MCDVMQKLSHTFIKHHEYCRHIKGMAIEQLLSGERALTLQYAGRVPFELLQNALDRCEERVVMAQLSNALLVGNDGSSVSFDPAFRHDLDIGKDNKLSDFHALCSVHTSNKSPEDSYGNKGVGFRSVFSVGSSVRVWSRVEGHPGWWGLEMHRDFTGRIWEERLKEPAVRRGAERLLGGMLEPVIGETEKRPSFHFPLPLWVDALPMELPDWFDGLVTLVEVPLVTESSVRQVSAAFERLRGTHLDFVGLRKPHVEVRLYESERGVQVMDTTPQRSRSQLCTWSSQDDALRQKAVRAGLDIRGEVMGAVRWPPEPGEGPSEEARLYCYLPTEARGVFACDVHADFQLGIDRKHLDLTRDEGPGEYNRALVTRGVELNLLMVLRHLKMSDDCLGELKTIAGGEVNEVVWEVPLGEPREDLWRFLDPSQGQSVVFVNERSTNDLAGFFVTELRERLIPFDWDWREPAAWNRWARLAAAFFPGGGEKRSLRSYRQFWDATQRWISTRFKNPWCQSAKSYGRACLQALRDAGAYVIPETLSNGSEEEQALVERVVGILPPEPPSKKSSGKRSEQRLFFARDSVGELEIPSAIQERGRYVTGWVIPPSFQGDGGIILGTSLFSRVELYGELRQLPNGFPSDVWEFTPLHEDMSEARQRQEAVIRLAAQLYTLEVARGNQAIDVHQNRTAGAGWRGTWSFESALRGAGRALATLFLPLKKGGWLPARECFEDELEHEWLERLKSSVEGLEVRRFLTFLGVCTWEGRLRLIEGGTQGTVRALYGGALPWPPALCEATTANIALLMIPEEDLEGGAEALKRVRSGWRAGWLRQLAHLEGAQRNQTGDNIKRRLGVLEELGRVPWYPVSTESEDEEGWVQLPDAVEGGESRAAPGQLTIATQGNVRAQSVLKRVKPLSKNHHELLHAMGAMELSEQLEDPERARTLIQQLASSFPDISLIDDLRSRRGLAELFQRLAETLVKEDGLWAPGLPLLFFEPARSGNPEPLQSRRLSWGSVREVWVARDNSDREQVRRLFPEVPLLAATLGNKELSRTPLGRRGLELKYRIDHVPNDGAKVPELRKLLDTHIPHLLALAEVSRRYDRSVDVADVRARWERTTLRRYEDVWQSWWFASGPEEFEERTHCEGEFNDIFFELQTEPGKGTTGARILFDVVEGNSHPPLSWFANALANALLDGRIEPDWRAALSELSNGRERLLLFLDKAGVSQREVDLFKQQLEPLTPEQRRAHRAKVEEALRAVGLRLCEDDWDAIRGTTLTLDNVEGNFDRTEREVQRCFDLIEWEDHEKPFAVDFVCQGANRERWGRWLKAEKRHLRLLRHGFRAFHPDEELRDEKLMTHSLAVRLEQCASALFSRLDFDPEQVVTMWLGVHCGRGPVDHWLESLTQIKPIQQIVRTPKFSPVLVNVESPERRVLAPQSKADRRRQEVLSAGKGNDAEFVVLDTAIQRVQAFLRTYPAEQVWQALKVALPTRGTLWKDMDQASRTEQYDLRKLLHISRRWGSAGFDILSLEEADGGLQPVRYEVKALPRDVRRVRLFISMNELNVCRVVNGSPNVNKEVREHHQSGRWVLLGVMPRGIALELTGALDAVLDPNSKTLSKLAENGFRPDGLQLTLELHAPEKV